MTAPALPLIATTIARAIAPRKALTVSQWADAERWLSAKGSAHPGRWRTSRNPPLREPMDCMSARSTVHNTVLMFPIQFGKTEVAVNAVGYTMDHDPGPLMVCLPGEVSMNKWVAQKLNPMLDETPAAQRALTSVASRDAANTRTFKDFAGGQLYLEHAGSPSRLKSTTVRTLIVDELDEFAGALTGGDDPVEMLNGRTSAFPGTYKRLYISTPQMQGTSRIEQLWLQSDMRRYHVACPHCGHAQPLEWSGLHWSADGGQAWYACRECGVCIDEHHKTAMMAEADARSRAGDPTVGWVPEHPDRKIRGYQINGLYYQLGMGPRWADLVGLWRGAQNDPAKLKTFINDRLAEPWEDPAMRAVKHNVIADRAEPYPLRTAPVGVLAITAGVDTQDNRLAVHLTGWGRSLACWTLDYVELPGDPADDAVWVALIELLNKPIGHALGALMPIEAVAIDANGHRTEYVKDFVRRRLVRRPLCIFGAVPNNAPVLGKGKLQEVTVRGKVDKRGVMIHLVGTVAIKHWLYARLSTDADKPAELRLVHLSDELPPEYFGGLVAETYNPTKNRFEKRKGAPRNEPLDTWVYSFAAAHHPELRLHRLSKADWDAREARLLEAAKKTGPEKALAPVDTTPAPRTPPVPQGTRKRGGFATNW
jgi:phage terminase large subunit GpA-like protein